MGELFVGDFRIDIKRGEVIYQKNISTLEPKVLKVLLLLAEKPGEIIPRQKLLDEVWPDVIVEANTLQRCIAQLRKAFNDDAKTQAFITTHPRRGYSLVADVSWQNESVDSPLQKVSIQENTIHSKPRKTNKTLIVFVLFMATLLTLSIFWFSKKDIINGLSVKQITPLTATEAIEYRASFSPNGEYLAFQRYVTARSSHIWVKNLHDNSEYQLTRNAAIYGRAEWSPDGTQIALSRESAIKTVEKSKCYSITRLSFTLAKSSPQSVDSLIDCEQDIITSVTWLTDQSLVYTLGVEKNNPVVEVNINSKTTRILYQNATKSSYGLTFSKRNNKLAFLQDDDSINSNLLVFDLTTGKSEKIAINFPKGYDSGHWSGMNWHPLEDRFLISDNQNLIEVTMNGDFIEHPIMTYQRIYDPVYHPSGESIAATLGLADFDIAELYWGDSQSENGNVDSFTDRKLFRSTVSEGGAKYRPKTQYNKNRDIVFSSNRSGSYQLWFYDGKQLKQLSHFTKGQRIGSSVWSLDGNLLAVNIDNQLQLLGTNGNVEQVEKSLNIVGIYQWIDQNKLLMRVIKNQQSHIVLFDISSGKSKVLYQGFANWAQVDSQQNLYVSDIKGQVFQVVDKKKILVSQLTQYSLHKKFLIKSDTLFFSNGNGEFWQFELQSKEVKLIAKRGPRAVKLDDVDIENKRLLYLNYAQGRKEIVLIH